jgi:hypothetical protein
MTRFVVGNDRSQGEALDTDSSNELFEQFLSIIS